MKNRITTVFIICSLIIISTFFINLTDNDFDKTIREGHQIKSFEVKHTDEKETKLNFKLVHGNNAVKLLDTYFKKRNKANPSVRVLNQDSYIFQGERKVKGSSLGKYIVELTYTDTWLQEGAKEAIKSNRERLGKENNSLLKTIKVAYPPDDSMMVIYLGCNTKPDVEVFESHDEIEVILR